MNPSFKNDLNQQLAALGKRIDESIESIEVLAIQQNMTPSKMMTVDGKHMMSPLLLAKAECLSARVRLNLKE